ncbi:hypothetical protein RRG08_019827 [Elysia crispata]|uniref:Uncharacterized protein n=1 Tax=Elysia crispata TaxID=231223 RepID=A0AAE0ZJS1_9GAST|nr:hypothetical protein RRG08_019825 [Elysia crispata]KAK3770739.1 hypothetical protein RRG08_019827 [Elysia crispata]
MNLVTALRERGMQYIGTVRENRLKGCSLRLEKEIRKVLRRASGSCLEVNPAGVAESLVIYMRKPGRPFSDSLRPPTSAPIPHTASVYQASIDVLLDQFAH